MKSVRWILNIIVALCVVGATAPRGEARTVENDASRLDAARTTLAIAARRDVPNVHSAREHSDAPLYGTLPSALAVIAPRRTSILLLADRISRPARADRSIARARGPPR